MISFPLFLERNHNYGKKRTISKKINLPSVLAFDAQQFLVVFMRCGGSKKKKNCLASTENGFRIWLTSLLLSLCSRTNFLFTDAPSNVAPITFRNENLCACMCTFHQYHNNYTFNPSRSSLCTASQNGSNIRSPVRFRQGKWAYGNSRDDSSLFTMKARTALRAHLVMMTVTSPVPAGGC